MLGIELIEGTWCGEYAGRGNMVLLLEYAQGKYGVGE